MSLIAIIVSLWKPQGEEYDIPSEIKILEEKCTALTSEVSIIKKMEKEVRGMEISKVSDEYEEVKTAAKAIELYYFNDLVQFLCVEFNEGGYAVMRLATREIYERAEIGNSPYSIAKSNKYYYLGLNNYFYKNKNGVFSILTKTVVSNKEKTTLQNGLKELFDREELFLQENRTEQQNENLEVQKMADYGRGKLFLIDKDEDMDRTWYFPLLSEHFFGGDKWLYEENEHYNDLLYPYNDGTSCGIVSMTMILQFYERLGYADMIPAKYDAFLDERNRGIIKETEQNIISLLYPTKSQHLHNELNNLTSHGALDENWSHDIVPGYNAYFKKYSYDKISVKYNALWANMKENIDRWAPAIGMTGLTGTGYYSSDGSYVGTSVARHQMVVYGYTKNSIGGLDEFVCHAGWFETPNSSIIFTSGWNFTSNVTITENF